MIAHLTSHLDWNFGGHLAAALVRLLGITVLEKKYQKRCFQLCLKLDTAFVICIWKRELIPGDKLCEELENTLCELQAPPHCGKISPGDRDHDRDVDHLQISPQMREVGLDTSSAYM